MFIDRTTRVGSIVDVHGRTQLQPRRYNELRKRSNYADTEISFSFHALSLRVDAWIAIHLFLVTAGENASALYEIENRTRYSTRARRDIL